MHQFHAHYLGKAIFLIMLATALVTHTAMAQSASDLDLSVHSSAVKDVMKELVPPPTLPPYEANVDRSASEFCRDLAKEIGSANHTMAPPQNADVYMESLPRRVRSAGSGMTPDRRTESEFHYQRECR